MSSELSFDSNIKRYTNDIKSHNAIVECLPDHKIFKFCLTPFLLLASFFSFIRLEIVNDSVSNLHRETSFYRINVGVDTNINEAESALIAYHGEPTMRKVQRIFDDIRDR